MQHLIRETKRAKNSIQLALKAAYQPLLNTTLMWCAGGIELPLYNFASKLSCNVDNIIFFDAFSEFFLHSNKLKPLSDQILASVPLRDTNHLTRITQELVSMDVTISTWTSRVVRKVKRNPHTFPVERRTVTKKGPNSQRQGSWREEIVMHVSP